LGRSARRGEGTGFGGDGGEAESGEQCAGERRVGDDGDDASAPTAGALEHVVGEHAAQEVGPLDPRETEYAVGAGSFSWLHAARGRGEDVLVEQQRA
jgi:hypothetical protein